MTEKLGPEKIVGVVEFHGSSKKLFRNHGIKSMFDIFKIHNN